MLVGFIQEYISLTAPLRHKLTVHVIPDVQNQNQNQPASATETGTDDMECVEEEVDFPLPEVLVYCS